MRRGTRSYKAETRVRCLLKKGDLVVVIAGGSGTRKVLKGKTGKILSFVGRKRDRIIVEGLNMIVRHKRQSAPGKESGRLEKEGSLHVSNVMYYVEKLKLPVRLCHRILEDGSKVRGYRDPENGEFVQI